MELLSDIFAALGPGPHFYDMSGVDQELRVTYVAICDNNLDECRKLITERSRQQRNFCVKEAAKRGYAQLVRLFMAHGASAGVALTAAVQHERFNTCQLILDEFEPRRGYFLGEGHLLDAVLRGSLRLCRLILQSQQKFQEFRKERVIMAAVEANNVAMCRLLLEFGFVLSIKSIGRAFVRPKDVWVLARTCDLFTGHWPNQSEKKCLLECNDGFYWNDLWKCNQRCPACHKASTTHELTHELTQERMRHRQRVRNRIMSVVASSALPRVLLELVRDYVPP